MVDIVIVAAHPDDAELSMGGTILLLKEKGFKVGVVDLTNGEPTPFGTVKKRMAERDLAGKVLGIDERVTLDLPNRELQPTLEARRKLAEVLRDLKPKILFGHYHIDAHPDHIAASHITGEARFWAKLTKTDMKGDPHYPARLYYHQANHLRLTMKPAFGLDISRHLEAKLKAAACYKTQFHTRDRRDFLKARLSEMAGYAGGLIGARYGELFYSDETIGLCDIRDLVELSCGENKKWMADIEAWRKEKE